MKLTAMTFAAIMALAAGYATAADELALATKSGCMGCHKPDGKLVGPSFQDIAAKYKKMPNAVNVLAARVKSGSPAGEALKWGTVPMPPNPASEEDIRTVVKWILTH
jgi:cytochrome c